MITIIHRELTSTRRENHWKEQQLLRREREITRSTRIASMVDGIRNLKYLLSEFDAINNTFWKWKHLLELLKNLYQLDDNFIKNFNKFKFKKRRALIHFCWKAEYLMLSEDILEEIKQMFNLRPGKLLLKKRVRGQWMKGKRIILQLLPWESNWRYLWASCRGRTS